MVGTATFGIQLQVSNDREGGAKQSPHLFRAPKKAALLFGRKPRTFAGVHPPARAEATVSPMAPGQTPPLDAPGQTCTRGDEDTKGGNKKPRFREVLEYSGTIRNVRMVPHAGIEPALLSELDFESSASTSSANGAIHAFSFGRTAPDYTKRVSAVNRVFEACDHANVDAASLSVIWPPIYRPDRRQ